MKKKDLELARKQFLNTSTTATALRERVSKDLNVVRDAYEVGELALIELSKLIANVAYTSGTNENSAQHEQVREIAALARAYADVSKSIVTLRNEVRSTVDYHSAVRSEKEHVPRDVEQKSQNPETADPHGSGRPPQRTERSETVSENFSSRVGNPGGENTYMNENKNKITDEEPTLEELTEGKKQ